MLFAVNFAMDFLALFISAKLMRRKIRTGRFAAAAALGAAYGVVEVCIRGNRLLTFFTAAGCALLMCLIVSESIACALKMLVVFGGVSFGIGGAMTALFELIGENVRRVKINGTVEELRGDIPPGMLIILAAAAAALTYLSEFIRRKRPKKPAEVKITANGREVSMSGLWDGGNLLCEPLTGTAVIIVGDDTLRSLYSGRVLEKLTTRPADCEPLDEPDDSSVRLRLIPMKTASGSELVFGIKADTVIDGTSCEAIICGTDESNLPGGDDGRPMAIVPESFQT